MKAICENCGATESTPASVDAICMFCGKGRMRADFILRLDVDGSVKNTIVLEYSPTLHELKIRRFEMLEMKPASEWIGYNKIPVMNGML